jgi:rubrerythrin
MIVARMQQLHAMLERCQRLEERAAALYRSYAAASRAEPELCAFWTALAREEEEHARAIARARARLEPTASWRTWLEGWDDALAEVEERLAAAEQVGPESTTARQLSAALELEMSELDALRHVLIATCGVRDDDQQNDHAARLADAAKRLSDDPQVRLQAALLTARTYLKKFTSGA